MINRTPKRPTEQNRQYSIDSSVHWVACPQCYPDRDWIKSLEDRFHYQGIVNERCFFCNSPSN